MEVHAIPFSAFRPQGLHASTTTHRSSAAVDRPNQSPPIRPDIRANSVGRGGHGHLHQHLHQHQHQHQHQSSVIHPTPRALKVGVEPPKEVRTDVGVLKPPKRGVWWAVDEGRAGRRDKGRR